MYFLIVDEIINLFYEYRFSIYIVETKCIIFFFSFSLKNHVISSGDQ